MPIALQQQWYWRKMLTLNFVLPHKWMLALLFRISIWYATPITSPVLSTVKSTLSPWSCCSFHFLLELACGVKVCPETEENSNPLKLLWYNSLIKWRLRSHVRLQIGIKPLKMSLNDHFLIVEKVFFFKIWMPWSFVCVCKPLSNRWKQLQRSPKIPKQLP